ncbi:MAG TPA: DDE-type integrase/transposase/recombinase [Candidatus Dormibacteraeota bacterium]|nr:DDE-type integrase/transposase/recombinase [Candidatus Dormibacteraeota bacterium]
MRTWEGRASLVTVIDLASRRAVGWAMADHLRADLVRNALRMAIEQRQPVPGLTFPSDRGSRCTSALLARHGIRQSRSRPRPCRDHAVVESFDSTPKVELIHRHARPTRAQAQPAVFEYVEVFYNRQRLHSTLGYPTPAAYETRRASAHWAGAA